MEEELILSVCVGILFFIVKLITIKLNKKLTDDQKTEQHKTVFRDSIMVVFITAISLFAKKEFFSIQNGKTRVFTNEPGF